MGKKRRFHVELSCVVEIDADVIRAVNKEWRSKFYDLNTPEEVAQHLAFNLLVNGAVLSQLDGWADKEDDAVNIPRELIDVQAEEIRRA
jgi:hypothetical protein